MSVTLGPQIVPRLQRSELAVPGANSALFEKAARSAADCVFLDLEDAVAPDDKAHARKLVIEGVNDVDWGNKTLLVRINGLDTPYMYRDLIEVVESCPRLDMLIIPKVNVAADVYMVDTLVSQIEQAQQRDKRLGLEALIETALGMTNLEAIAQSSRRLEALSFGPGDYAASIRARTTGIGGVSADYGVLTDDLGDGRREFHWNDMWHFALSRLVMVCRAYGLRPLDGPLADFGDIRGLQASARRAAALGCEGKWVIHPSQIAPINELFSPSDAEVEQARRIVDALDEAGRQGRGAVQLDGRMIDIASIRMAQGLLCKAEAINSKGSE